MFKDFEEDDLPNIFANLSNNEIFLEWRGKELSIVEVLEIIDKKEYIEPNDFD